MISKLWRQRLGYAAMSVFAAWHTMAMVIAPAPDGSEMVQAARHVFQPYMSLFRVDNLWDFFAPNVEKQSQLRYTIENAAGESQTFEPASENSWFLPGFFWHRAYYSGVIETPEDHADSLMALFCRQHAKFNPVSITLLKVEEGDFAPADQLAGKHPMDPEFVTISTVKSAQCKQS